MRPMTTWILASAFAAAPAGAQTCRGWGAEFAQPGLGGPVAAFAEFGGELVAGGGFELAAGVPMARVARWDGVRWRPLGTGIEGGTFPSVNALAVHDDGGGQALFAGGSFEQAGGVAAKNVARWDGSSWSALSSASGPDIEVSVHAMEVFDSGSGPELVVAGDPVAGAASTARVARWDGTNWIGMGDDPGAGVRALARYDDGGGEKLYAGGYFTMVGGLVTGSIARWDGVQWETVGGSAAPNGLVEALAVYDEGAGPRLFAVGRFPKSGSPFHTVMRWDLTHWTGVDPSSAFTPPFVYDAEVHDVGAGPTLFVGGATTMSSWDGSVWTPDIPGRPKGIVTFYSRGTDLVVGGGFTAAKVKPAPSAGAATWDGVSWKPLGSGFRGPDEQVNGLEFFDEGAGPVLFAGGVFLEAGGSPFSRIARWDGAAWSDVGGGLDGDVYGLRAFDDGSGSALYAVGDFGLAGGAVAVNRVGRWDGATWSAVGNGLPGNARAVIDFDDGSGAALWVGGLFQDLYRWDGSSWRLVPNSGLFGIDELAVHDAGSGPELYAAAATQIVRWDGAAWSPVGTVDVSVDSLASYDGGAGPELYAGGGFNKVNGVFSPHIARWNGSQWQPVGVNSFQSSFRDLVTYDDGGGERLLGIGPPGAWAWDGNDWEPFQGGVVSTSRCSVVHGEDLYIGGYMDSVGSPGMLVDRIARFGPDCDCPPLGYCTAGTTTNGCTAAISAAGLASVGFPSGFQVDVTGVEGQKQGLLYFGVNGAKATPWGGSTSWACVKGPHQRLSPMTSGGTAGDCDGGFAIDFNAWMAANPAKAPGPGSGVWMQAWFRDPPAPKTTAFSDGLFFTVCP